MRMLGQSERGEIAHGEERHLPTRERHAIHAELVIVGDPLAGLCHSTIHADPAVLDQLVCFFEREISH